MDFHKKRRQQFLGEHYYLDQIPRFASVLHDDDGLEANLKSPERQRGWHSSLARGVGLEKFSRLTLRYTAGEPIEGLRQDLEEVVAAYERYGDLLWEYRKDRNAVVFEFTSVDDYCELMQLIGLCFLLHRRDVLPRLAALQDGVSAIGQRGEGNGGADWLFEEFMAFGVGAQKRFESEQLCCSKPYEALADALSDPDDAMSLQHLDRFLKRWYKDLAGAAWHDSHRPDENGNQGGYFGYWSFEAGAAVLLLGIEDDSSLHAHIHYPRDLVAWARVHAALSGDAQRPGAAPPDTALRCEAGASCPRAGWWFTPARADSRRRFALGETMPGFGGDYGRTLWQWDARQ